MKILLALVPIMKVLMVLVPAISILVNIIAYLVYGNVISLLTVGFSIVMLVMMLFVRRLCYA